MESESKPTKRVPKSKVSMPLKDIPMSVHNKIKRYKRKINSERQADYNIKEAYVEFLKEKTATVKTNAD